MNKFTRACEMSFNDWLSTIPDVVPEAEYSKNHEKWKKKLFNKMRGDRYHSFTTQTLKVMLVAAVLTTLLLTAFVIPSSREFIIDNFEIFSTYKLTEHNNNSVNDEITVGYIPEEFELKEWLIDKKGVMYKYVSPTNKSIIISKQSSSVKVDIDTEYVENESIVINNITYVYYLDENYNSSLIWNKNDYIYHLIGDVSREEILKVAENIK